MLPNKSNNRRIFLRQVREELCLPIIRSRSTNVQVMRHFSCKLAIESMLHKSPTMTDVPSTSGTVQQRDKTGRKRVVGSCYIYQADPDRKRRKTRKYCQNCIKPVFRRTRKYSDSL